MHGKMQEMELACRISKVINREIVNFQELRQILHGSFILLSIVSKLDSIDTDMLLT